jgi:hypothetical protein
MKATEKSPKAGKLASCLIVAFVVAGTVSLSVVADLDQGSGIVGILFIAFLGAIIAVQLIPGLMLFGMMAKGIASMFHKAVAQKETK